MRGRYSERFCGLGSPGKCRRLLWHALQVTGKELAKVQGKDPKKWRADATGERIEFGPVPLHEMRYTNRPSGIQQVITFTGHR